MTELGFDSGVNPKSGDERFSGYKKLGNKEEGKMKKVLVTAGSTQTQIDQVRVISNIFKGTTGTRIAQHFCQQGAQVKLLTSNPGLVTYGCKLKHTKYKTFAELKALMEKEITQNHYDVIIHSAAVSDYECTGVMVKDDKDSLVELSAATKVSSQFPELFLRLKPTDKLIDLIRSPWGFQGSLIKFKLQVGMPTEELIAIAQKSREHSQADLIVANCLEWSREYAYILSADQCSKVSRQDLAQELYRRVGQ
jgi:phosphopantothenoylcysteine synthetase/decarboxylase